jgi:hypothetical protein
MGGVGSIQSAAWVSTFVRLWASFGIQNTLVVCMQYLFEGGPTASHKKRLLVVYLQRRTFQQFDLIEIECPDFKACCRICVIHFTKHDSIACLHIHMDGFLLH